MNKDDQNLELIAKDKVDPKYEELCLNSYRTYEKTLRTWFVAYGIGAPILFLSNNSVWNKIAASKYSNCIATLFLVGVFLQIFIALLNKHSMWYCYRGEGDKDFQKTFSYKISFWLSDKYWIDRFIN
jgi:hypothetical protein